jgi:hypothetical protein
MPSSAMLFRVALVGNDVSEETSASIIRMRRIGELETTLAVTSNRPCSYFADCCHLDDGDVMFLWNVESYKSNTA